MTHARLALAASLLAAPLATKAAAQPAAPAPAPAAGPWQVDFGRHYCTMIRSSGEGRAFSTALVVVPGSLSSELMLLSEGEAALPRRIDRIVLMPGGRAFEVGVREERRAGRAAIALHGLDYGFRDLLAGASELLLQEGDMVRARISLNGARAAVTAHRRCTAEIAREWQVDEAAQAALAEQPRSNTMLGFRSEDYPTGPLAAGTQGRVSMRITITPQGRAGDCTVVESSGDAAIDARSCRVARLRGRFQPGRDAAGRRVAMPYIFTVTWIISAS